MTQGNNPSESERSRPGPGAESDRVAGYLRGAHDTFREVEDWIRAELRQRYAALRSEHEDLAQIVHGKLLENLRAHRFEARSSLRTYVTGIVHYTAIDRLRELYRQRTVAESLAGEPLPSRKGPYGAMEAAEDGKLLHAAVMALPPGCRQLWRLVLLDRLSYEEVGRRLSIPPGTVKSRMWHCRRRAQKILRRLRLRGGEARRIESEPLRRPGDPTKREARP